MQQSKDNIEVTCDFKTPVEKLYQAWTRPDELKKWWKTTGYQLQDVTNDLKEGGKVEYRFENDDLVINGNYETVEENKLLAYTWNWNFKKQPDTNGNYKLTVRFESTADGSTISIRQQNFDKEENVLPKKEGWDKGMEDLKHYLEGNNAANHDNSNPGDVENGGYREDPEQIKVGGA